MAKFSEVQPYLRQGMTAYRTEWPEGDELYLVPSSTFKVSRAPLNAILPEGTEVTYEPHYDVIDADNVARVWSPTQADLMTNDWSLGLRGWIKNTGRFPKEIKYEPLDMITAEGHLLIGRICKDARWDLTDSAYDIVRYRKSPGWKPDTGDIKEGALIDFINREGYYFGQVRYTEDLPIKFWRIAP